MQRAAAGAVLAVPLLLLAGLSWGIVVLNHGHFGYTLDDPYIHLALAEELLRGNHGVNPGELAAPASSILYPWLLAGGLATGLGDFGPMVLGVAALVALLVLVHGYIRWLWPTATPLALAAGAVLAVQMANGIAIVLTGMEHSLHLLATAAVAVGLARALIAPDRPAAERERPTGGSTDAVPRARSDRGSPRE